MLLEKGQRTIGGQFFRTIDIIGQRQLRGSNIQSGIGHRRIAIAEMRSRESDVQVKLAGEHPTQIDAEVHVGRQL